MHRLEDVHLRGLLTLFGDYDRHLVTIESRLGVHIAARGNRVQIEGDADSAARASITVALARSRCIKNTVDAKLRQAASRTSQGA